MKMWLDKWILKWNFLISFHVPPCIDETGALRSNIQFTVLQIFCSCEAEARVCLGSGSKLPPFVRNQRNEPKSRLG